jgi:hypothetical protein
LVTVEVGETTQHEAQARSGPHDEAARYLFLTAAFLCPVKQINSDGEEAARSGPTVKHPEHRPPVRFEVAVPRFI